MMHEYAVGDRVRLLEREYIGAMQADGTFPVTETGSMATVNYVMADGWGVFVNPDGYPGEANELLLHRSEFEWVERPEPLQRSCDSECDHV
jgi:hypothetical protein